MHFSTQTAVSPSNTQEATEIGKDGNREEFLKNPFLNSPFPLFRGLKRLQNMDSGVSSLPSAFKNVFRLQRSKPCLHPVDIIEKSTGEYDDKNAIQTQRPY